MYELNSDYFENMFFFSNSRRLTSTSKLSVNKHFVQSFSQFDSDQPTPGYAARVFNTNQI